METYTDQDNDSNIVAYEIGDNYIIVQFGRGRECFYKYTYNSAGQSNIEHMKQLAQAGDGLNGFIVENKIDYESKW